MSTQETLHLPQGKFTQPNFQEYLPQGIQEGGVVPLDWFDTAFKSRIPLTVQSSQIIGGTKTNFQMLVNSTFPNSFTDNVQTDGRDIRFAGVDTVELKYEIEGFNNVSGLLTAWVLVPSIDTGKIIYMYFNNSGATDAQDAPAVWNATNKNLATWHLNQTTYGLGTTKDSTGEPLNNLNTVNMSLTNFLPFTKIGAGQSFDGVNQDAQKSNLSAKIQNLGVSTTDLFTIMAWVKPTFPIIPSADHFFGAAGGGIGFSIGTATAISFVALGIGVFNKVISALVPGAYVHLVAKCDLNFNITFYVNGVNVGLVSGFATPFLPTANVYAIGCLGNGPQHFDGEITEIEIYNTDLTDDQVKSIYNTQHDSGEPLVPGFYAIGAQTNI